jgi:hypothetical protein
MLITFWISLSCMVLFSLLMIVNFVKIAKHPSRLMGGNRMGSHLVLGLLTGLSSVSTFVFGILLLIPYVVNAIKDAQ